MSISIIAFTLVGLMAAGAVGAKTAGSRLLVPTLRVLIGGSLGMAITAGIGALFHASTV
jgi:hypothetical protein